MSNGLRITPAMPFVWYGRARAARMTAAKDLILAHPLELVHALNLDEAAAVQARAAVGRLVAPRSQPLLDLGSAGPDAAETHRCIPGALTQIVGPSGSGKSHLVWRLAVETARRTSKGVLLLVDERHADPSTFQILRAAPLSGAQSWDELAAALDRVQVAVVHWERVDRAQDWGLAIDVAAQDAALIAVDGPADVDGVEGPHLIAMQRELARIAAMHQIPVIVTARPGGRPTFRVAWDQGFGGVISL